MNERDVNKRKKQIAALLFAADDMIEAGVAADWFPEIENPFRKRLVVTGMVIAYARPFVTGDYGLDLEEYRPADPDLAELHDSLIRWRHKVYAHTDTEGGRTAMIIPASDSSSPTIAWRRNDFPVGQIAEALALFRSQRKRFEAEAENLQQALDAALAPPSA